MEWCVWIIQYFVCSLRYSGLYQQYSKQIPPIHIYINKITSCLVSIIKDGYKIEWKAPETMKLKHKQQKYNK